MYVTRDKFGNDATPMKHLWIEKMVEVGKKIKEPFRYGGTFTDKLKFHAGVEVLNAISARGDTLFAQVHGLPLCILQRWHVFEDETGWHLAGDAEINGALQKISLDYANVYADTGELQYTVFDYSAARPK